MILQQDERGRFRGRRGDSTVLSFEAHQNKMSASTSNANNDGDCDGDDAVYDIGDGPDWVVVIMTMKASVV